MVINFYFLLMSLTALLLATFLFLYEYSNFNDYWKKILETSILISIFVFSLIFILIMISFFTVIYAATIL
jgi:hypothetical protein